MMSDLSWVFPVLIVAVPILLLIMLLPAVVELKKPRDAGPRLIVEDVFGVSVHALKVGSIMDIEADYEFGVKLPSTVAGVLGFLPVLDG
jgi:hypothetical protein